MNRKTGQRLCAIAGLLLMAGGCAVTPAPPVQWLVLAPLSAPATSQGAAAAGPDVIVGPVDLPAYTARAPLLLLRNEAEMEAVADARWAEPLDSSVTRVLVENLSRLLATGRVSTLGGDEHAGGAQVAIEITEFVTTTDGEARVTAYWRVLADGGRTVRHAARSRLVEPVAAGGAVEHALALSRALATLSGDIAAAIRATATP